MKILWPLLVAVLVSVPNAASACVETYDGPPCDEYPTNDSLVLEYEEDTCSGDVCTEAWFDCMSFCGATGGNIRYHNGRYWGLSDCTTQYSSLVRRIYVRCYYDVYGGS